jgi:hypothetical protein
MPETHITKRLVVGTRQWGIADADAEQVAGLVQDAMTNGTRVALPLLDGTKEHSVTVYLDGAATSVVEIDLLMGPRPTEMS